MPRLFAIGDVHGCDTALKTLRGRITPQAGDTVVFLGDLVDRGPDTKHVLEQVLELRQICRVIVIQGNHEEMMLRALAGDEVRMWMQCGGKEALHSYGGRTSAIPASHVELLRDSLDYWESSAAIFIHANLQAGLPLSEQFAACLRWSHLTGGERRFDPSRRVICGHTPQKNGLPLVMPGWVCLDTDCQRGGWLSALDMDADWVYQANEQGDTRDFVLGSLP